MQGLDASNVHRIDGGGLIEHGVIKRQQAYRRRYAPGAREEIGPGHRRPAIGSEARDRRIGRARGYEPRDLPAPLGDYEALPRLDLEEIPREIPDKPVNSLCWYPDGTSQPPRSR